MLLELRDIHVHYGKIEALKGISLEVAEGEIVSLIGANGAGKTTTLKTVSGVRPVSHGRVLFNGQDITRTPGHKRVRLGISQAPEGRGTFIGMTVEENILMGAYARRGPVADELAEVYELFPRLKERRTQVAGTLSGGEQQMLAIGRALLARPQVMLLDEPSMGLAPKLVQQIFEIIGKINQRGTTILLVEQNASQALQLAHRAYVLETGSIMTSAPAAQLLDDPAVRAAYLGGDVAAPPVDTPEGPQRPAPRDPAPQDPARSAPEGWPQGVPYGPSQDSSPGRTGSPWSSTAGWPYPAPRPPQDPPRGWPDQAGRLGE